MSDIQTLNEKYWVKLNEKIKNYSNFSPTKPDSNAYYLPLGSNLAHISMKVNSVKMIQECKVVISDNKQLFDNLYASKEEIENKLGFELDWDRKSGKESHITIKRDFNIRNYNEWDDAIAWHLIMAFKFYDAFSDRIKMGIK